MGDMLVLMVGCGTWTVCGLGGFGLGIARLGDEDEDEEVLG